MKAIIYFVKRLLQNLWWDFLFLGGFYGFLGICNWSAYIGEWNGFSKFLFALLSLAVFYVTWQMMDNVVKNIKLKRHLL